MRHQDIITFSQRGVGPIVKATNAGKVSIMPDLPQDAAEEYEDQQRGNAMFRA
jgi:hypothetical protein